MSRRDLKSPATTLFDSSQARRRFRRRLLGWYERHARDLPWRRTADPYAIWVSEIMLQQTQVVAVIPYYERFLADFPTISDLAAAPEHEVLRRWEGLGYYRRARNLHRAAQQLAANCCGQFPKEYDHVLSLPGIGRYTAGAILSIAFDQRTPILEANTFRLLSRLIAFTGDPRSSAGQNKLWQVAEMLLPRRGVGRFNQALMELGAEVCRVRDPACETCPVRSSCAAYQCGLVQNIPRAPRRPPIEQVHEAAVVVFRRGRFLLVRRDDHERWAGMWDFPRAALEAETNGPAVAVREAIQRAVEKQTGMQVRLGSQIAEIRHGVTRFRITLACYDADYVGKASKRPRPMPELCWVDRNDVHGYALPVPARRLARIVLEQPRLS